MQFSVLGPNPIGELSLTYGGTRTGNSSASRAIKGANGEIALYVKAKDFSRFSGTKGNRVVVTFYYIGSTRFRLQFFFGNGTQIGGDITSVTGIAAVVTALAADATLSKYFTAAALDTTTQAMEDGGAGVGNGKNMTGGKS